MQIMEAEMCDHCNIGQAIGYCKTHMARVCHQRECDRLLHSVTVDNPDHSRFLLCNNCGSQTAVVQCLYKGFFLCQTCVSNANVMSRFLCYSGSNKNSVYSHNSPLDLDLDSSSLSSLIDLNWGFSFVSSSLFQPDSLGIPKKDSPCSVLDGQEDTENVLMNNFHGDGATLDLKEFFSDLIGAEHIFDEITKPNSETTTKILASSSSGMSSVIHKDYNIEAMANASSQDYTKNQMIGSPEAKEETNNNLGIFPNAIVQLDSCGPSQLILTDEMLLWEDQKLVPEHKYDPRVRQEALKRYFAKKKKRKFGKKIRYESRKSTADTKRRMKGRFTKAGAEYDYDPRANNDINKETIKIMTQ
ncbi:hypothetical protein AALP_AA1G050500 [Arabis alpina]|uniref:CCT domain-containing protein n=1 Tax=Arabis alpina TaxID=50452 RepID=A0A087HL76_ARAAL|nr:hypothetical protein AALP_AA1G050500 [Arabis alpina]